MQAPLPTNELNSALAFISALSVASERVVAVIKNAWPWLRDEKPAAATLPNFGQEEWRRIIVTAISYLSSLLISVFFLGGTTVVLGASKHQVSAFVLSFLALGGSAFWAQVIGVLSAVKDAQQQQADASSGPAPRLRTLP